MSTWREQGRRVGGDCCCLDNCQPGRLLLMRIRPMKTHRGEEGRGGGREGGGGEEVGGRREGGIKGGGACGCKLEAAVTMWHALSHAVRRGGEWLEGGRAREKRCI